MYIFKVHSAMDVHILYWLSVVNEDPPHPHS